MIEVRSLLRRARCVAWPPALRPVVDPLLPAITGRGARARAGQVSLARARAWRGGGEECEGEERSVLVFYYYSLLLPFLLFFPGLLVFFFFSRLFSWLFFPRLY